MANAIRTIKKKPTCTRSVFQARSAAISSHRAQDSNRVGAIRAGRTYYLRHAGAVVLAAADRIVPAAHEQRVEGAQGAVVADAATLEVRGCQMRLAGPHGVGGCVGLLGHVGGAVVPSRALFEKQQT